jgi:AcrR family transcriptional regulator
LIASALIEEGGVEAASLAAVSERAGCTRPLVYRYFKSKEDLLVALVNDYYERVDAQISEVEQRRVIGAVSDQGADALRNLIGLYWDTMNEVGLGGPIVRCTPHYSERLRALAADSRERHEARFIEPWVEAGLPRLVAETTVDGLLATFVALALRARRGELDREQAIDLTIRIQASQLTALGNRAPGDPVPETN